MNADPRDRPVGVTLRVMGREAVDGVLRLVRLTGKPMQLVLSEVIRAGLVVVEAEHQARGGRAP